MSDLRITKRDEKEQSSDWMTLVHEGDNQVLIDVLSIAKSLDCIIKVTTQKM